MDFIVSWFAAIISFILFCIWVFCSVIIDHISLDCADMNAFISLTMELRSFDTTVWAPIGRADAFVLLLVFEVVFVSSATLGGFASGDVSIGELFLVLSRKNKVGPSVLGPGVGWGLFLVVWLFTFNLFYEFAERVDAGFYGAPKRS